MQAALDAGFDESMQKAIGRYEDSDFSPAAKAALRLCDAMITRPTGIRAELREELAKHFSEAQIVELCVG